ncbi:uncharacterized protein V1513DRAFT_374475 [Lipomyces chichibuensis]|uniref:uncharacterized protein n=1 Tax=Lipomyces chichibuensis TaxID=1546026 RepID=UPI0033434A72
MPGERELFPDHPRASPPAGTRSLQNILAQSMHDLNLESTNHDRDQITNISSLTSTVSQQAAVQIPGITTSRAAPNHHPSLLSPSALRQPQPIPPPSHRFQYSSTAPIEGASHYQPSRYHSSSASSPLSAMHYPQHYTAQYPQRFTSTSSITSESGLSGRSPISSESISLPSSSSTPSCERDLFPQATQLDLRIPMLPDPSPLSEPLFFFSNDHDGKDSTIDDQHHARRSKQRKHHTHSRTPSTATTSQQVGIPASAAMPAGMMSSVGTPTDGPVAVRVQFREEMLCGDGGCIDDDDDEYNDHEVLDEWPNRQSKSSVTSIRESEYDADEDDVSDAPDEGVFVRGRTPSTWYEQPVRQIRRPLDGPRKSGMHRKLFPDMNLDDD